MKTAVRLVLLGLVLALGYWAWTFFFPSPKKIIRQHLEQMAKLASFTEREGALAKLANGQKLAAFFDEHVEFRVEAPGMENHTFESRSDLTEAIIAARNVARSVHVELFDISVEVTPGNQEAIANAAMRGDLSGQKDALVEQLKFNFKKKDGQWLVSAVVSEK